MHRRGFDRQCDGDPLRVGKGGTPVLPTWQAVLVDGCNSGGVSPRNRGGGFPPDPPSHEAVRKKRESSSTGTGQLIRPVPIEKQSAVGHLDQSSSASSDEIFPFLLRLERSFGGGADEDIDTFVHVHREDLRRSQGKVGKCGDRYLSRPHLAEPVFPPLLRRERGGKRRWRS